MNYIADFNGPIKLGLFMLTGIRYYDVGRYVLFRHGVPSEVASKATRIIETSDLEPTVFYWARHRLDKDKEGCRLTEEDKQELTLIMLQCDVFKD